jgi:alpha-beta hydrolase superfamily lysophospholipase
MSKYFIAMFLSLSIVLESSANNREDTICGVFKEPLLFWLWSSTAPDPDKSRVSHLNFVEPSEYKTSDGKTLRGYKYLSNDGNGRQTPAKGYVLMALGNAMISDQIIGYLREFSEKHFDVYIYDYRGYGNSDGKRRINAIIEDYKEIAASLNESYERKLFYGISLGGAVILNVIGSGVEYDAAVIDSSPSLLSTYGCPKRIDPLVNLPQDASKLLIITGQKDSVLGERMTSKLRESAYARGAKTVNDENFSHPFMDRSVVVHNQRMELVLKHLIAPEIGDYNEK